MITPAVISPAALAGPYGAGNSGTYEDKIRAGCAEFERILLRQMLREVLWQTGKHKQKCESFSRIKADQKVHPLRLAVDNGKP